MSEQTRERRAWLLVIPDPGVGWLNINAGAERYERARKVKAWRDAAHQWARHARVPRLQRAHVLATIHPATRQRRDPGNWYPTAKACLDGVVADAGVLPNDDGDHVFGPDLREGALVGRGRPVRLSLLITELLDGDSDPLLAALTPRRD